MATEEFKHESRQDIRSIGKYLRAVIDGLESGCLEFSDDDGKLILEPRGLLGLELRAKRKGSRVRFYVKLSWSEETGKARPDSLKVSAGNARPD